ncbi:MAG TPA: hypothetical protein DCR93_26050 [Cytophagales bacterium]|nr:hypothetical protein [Cytophagales bacterium]HAP62810.1 hypothetical protein [Cytophagales bacterium]
MFRNWSVGLLLFCTLSSSVALAQDGDSEEEPEKEKKERAWSILPIPAVAFTPETRWLFGPVAAITYTPPKDTVTRPTTFTLYAIWTQERQFYSIVSWNTWTKNNLYNITGRVDYYDFPEFFYGVNYDNPASNRELYASKRLEGFVSVGREIRKDLYGGLMYYTQSMWDMELEPGGVFERENVVGADGGFHSGVGYLVRFDNRVQPLNPKESMYFELNHIFFNSAFGSVRNFSRLTYDFRKFWEIPPLWGEENHILAVNSTGMFHTGDVPFRMTAAMGGRPVRGYYWGRYRDRQYWSAQVEYRMPVWWRLGVTGFAAVGQMAPSLGQFGSTPLRPGVGVGVRILALAGINIRADFTWGLGVEDSESRSNTYIDIGETF